MDEYSALDLQKSLAIGYPASWRDVRTHNHASIWDKSVVTATNLGDRFQKAGADLVSKSESADYGWQLLHRPNLGNITLRGAPTPWRVS